MQDIEIARRYRALRLRLRWRQADVGQAAGLSQDVVSLIECGHLTDVSVTALRRVASALGAELRMTLLFRGGEVDRLVDEGHAAVVAAVIRRLGALGWEVRPEVSFAVFGERGSIDVIAWHAASRTLLVVEVKTELTSVEETLRRHDVKARVAAGVVAERFGWQPIRVARLLVLPDGTTPRRQVHRHDDVMRTAYPLRGSMLRRWLAAPAGSVAGLAFVPITTSDRGIRRAPTTRRVRRSAKAARGEMAAVGAGPKAALRVTHEDGSSKARVSGPPRPKHDERS